MSSTHHCPRGIFLLTHNPWNTTIQLYSQVCCPPYIFLTQISVCQLNIVVLVFDLHYIYIHIYLCQDLGAILYTCMIIYVNRTHLSHDNVASLICKKFLCLYHVDDIFGISFHVKLHVYRKQHQSDHSIPAAYVHDTITYHERLVVRTEGDVRNLLQPVWESSV